MEYIQCNNFIPVNRGYKKFCTFNLLTCCPGNKLLFPGYSGKIPKGYSLNIHCVIEGISHFTFFLKWGYSRMIFRGSLWDSNSIFPEYSLDIKGMVVNTEIRIFLEYSLDIKSFKHIYISIYSIFTSLFIQINLHDMTHQIGSRLHSIKWKSKGKKCCALPGRELVICWLLGWNATTRPCCPVGYDVRFHTRRH